MAKKRIIQRQHNRSKLVIKYSSYRAQHKLHFSKENSLKDRLQIHRSLQILPRNSSVIRLRNICQFSGRTRSYYRDFGLSRHFFRELAHQGILPRVRKSSW